MSQRTQILSPNLKNHSPLHCFNIPSLLPSNSKTTDLVMSLIPLIQGNTIGGNTVLFLSGGILGFLESLIPGNIGTNKLKELRTKNKWSSIQEKLTGDPGGWPERQRTKKLQGHLHLHSGAVPESSAAVSGSHISANSQMTKLNNSVMSLMSIIRGKTTHGLGTCRPTQAVKHSSRRMFGKSESN